MYHRMLPCHYKRKRSATAAVMHPLDPPAYYSRPSVSRNAKNGALVGNSMSEETPLEEEGGIAFSQDYIENAKAPTAGVVFYSRAWVDMLCQLQIVIPMLPAYLSEEQRYTTIRRFMTPKFIMVPEILRGQVDWKMPPGKSLLVLVHAIDSRSDTLWVAELLDETGSKIPAWIQPRFVEQEQKAPKHVRIGMVWMLKDVTIVLDSSPGRGVDDSSTRETNHEYKRMLLVGERNIEAVWAPPSNEEDSDTSDPRFIEWMEKRNTLTSSLEAAADECDLDLCCDNDENIPINTDRTINIVQEATPVSEIHTPPERESPRNNFLHSNDSSMLQTEFVQATSTRSPIDTLTVRDKEQVKDRQRQNDRPNTSSPSITRKRKQPRNNFDLGLWTVGPGNDFAALNCDDDDDDLDSDGQRPCMPNDNDRVSVCTVEDTSNRADHDPQLPAPTTTRQVTALESIFQNADFVTLELNCSSDED